MNSIHRINPLISVVIPLYNKQDYITSTIRSVLAQTYRNYEIVVVDDGSIDGSVEKVKKINSSKVKVIQRENGGDGAARNTGIRESNGELIAFLDGDDEWMPDFLNEIVNMYHYYPDAGLFSTGIKMKHRGNYTVDVYVDSGSNDNSISKVTKYFEMSIQRSFVTSSNVAVKKEIFGNIGYFFECIGVSCDRDMWARVAMNYDVICSSKVLAIYNCEHTSGRVSKSKMVEYKPPAIHHTVSKMLQENGINALHQSIIDFLHLNWFGRIDKAIRDGNLKEARRILKNEIVSPKEFRIRYWWTMIIIHLFPIGIVQKIFKLQRSRWFLWVGSLSFDRSFPRVVQKRGTA